MKVLKKRSYLHSRILMVHWKSLMALLAFLLGALVASWWNTSHTTQNGTTDTVSSSETMERHAGMVANVWENNVMEVNLVSVVRLEQTEESTFSRDNSKSFLFFVLREESPERGDTLEFTQKRVNGVWGVNYSGGLYLDDTDIAIGLLHAVRF